MPRITAPTVLLLVTALSLTGCSAVAEYYGNERSASFENAEDIEGNWGKDAPWVPADATSIETVEARNGEPAVVGLASTEELDPKKCAETERQSAPAFAPDWSPDNVFVESVFVCGDWAVMKTDDGWFGWTPVDPDEKEAVASK